MNEATYTTSSVGQVAYLLWKGITPQALTFTPNTACLYFDKEDDFIKLIEEYWGGDTVPACELSECIVVANRIFKNKKIEPEWFSEMREAIKDVSDDYIFSPMI